MINYKYTKEVNVSSGLDASICQQDCTKYEKSDFANKCKNDEGYFKCCVRNNSFTVFIKSINHCFSWIFH